MLADEDVVVVRQILVQRQRGAGSAEVVGAQVVFRYPNARARSCRHGDFERGAIGAAGAVGTRLCAALAARGHRVIATDRMTTLPNSLQRSIADRGTCIGGVDV